MLRTLIPKGTFTTADRIREHGRMLAGAVVVKARWMQPRIAKELGAALRERFVGPAREVPFLQTDRLEHAGRDRDVLRLSGVRRTRERQLVVSPTHCVGNSGLDE